MATVPQEAVLPNVRLHFQTEVWPQVAGPVLSLSRKHTAESVWCGLDRLFDACICGVSPQSPTGPDAFSLSSCPGANCNSISKEGCDWNYLSLAVSLPWPTHLCSYQRQEQAVATH